MFRPRKIFLPGVLNSISPLCSWQAEPTWKQVNQAIPTLPSLSPGLTGLFNPSLPNAGICIIYQKMWWVGWCQDGWYPPPRGTQSRAVKNTPHIHCHMTLCKVQLTDLNEKVIKRCFLVSPSLASPPSPPSLPAHTLSNNRLLIPALSDGL